MSNQRIFDSLNTIFCSQKIVFWHDPEAEFAESMAKASIDNVEIINIDHMPALQIKLLLERDGLKSKYLLYSAKSEPEPAKDWLLDVRLRSKSFYADSTSIMLDELGLQTHTLRPHLKTRAKFLNAKDRVERLKRFVKPSDTADEIDLKMIAVLARADQADVLSILFKLLSSLIIDGDVQYDGSKYWQDISSNQLEPAFWALMQKTFAYSDDNPSLHDLLIKLLVTEFGQTLLAGLPGQLMHFKLSEPVLAANAVVFVSRWRTDISYVNAYNELSSKVEQELGIASLLATVNAAALYDAMTFDVIEQRIIKELKDQVLASNGIGSDAIRSVIAKRRDGYWAHPRMAREYAISGAFSACYDALEASTNFYELKAQYDNGFSFVDAETALSAYKATLYRFDQYYRQFNYAADAVEPMGWSLLHELRSRIENAYSGWFIADFASAWSKVLEGDSGLLTTWQLPGWVNQQNFYDAHVKPQLQGSVKRAFVLISDAFRFEVAEELTRLMNSRNKYQATLSAMLGVLPSYTTLGMAALLPHKTLAYKRSVNLDMSADNLQVSTVEQRGALLENYNGIAIKHEDLMGMGKDKGREFVRDCSVVYIYHDRIDAIGDKQATETKTFEAAADTINELSQVINFIVNSLSGSTILVTADHGFMYQESALDVADKSSITDKPAGIITAKKRYMLGDNLGSNPKAWSGNTSISAGTEPGQGSVDYWLPKGAARFHFAGGARFVHGSAMPQEIVVPVITIKQSDSDKAKVRNVEFSLLGSSNKIVTNKQRFEFIQNDPVAERLLARTVTISVRDGDQLVSDEQTLSFDSASQSMEERKRAVILTVLAGSYDRNKDYYLTARDIQSKIEVLRLPVRIDLSFSNDF